MTIQDITEIKQTEAMLRRIENLSSLEECLPALPMKSEIPHKHQFQHPVAIQKFVMTSEMDRIIKTFWRALKNQNHHQAYHGFIEKYKPQYGGRYIHDVISIQ
jgi:hypothetical protein